LDRIIYSLILNILKIIGRLSYWILSLTGGGKLF
jgi:hypothetical protein